MILYCICGIQMKYTLQKAHKDAKKIHLNYLNREVDVAYVE